MKKNKTVTIGIPALNEEANIKHLLLDILAQKINDFYLEKIIVSSDGSNDNTVKLARSIKNKKIKVIDNHNRLGQGARQNQIIKTCKSDVLVLLNADIRITDKEFLSKLIDPIIKSQADLTSSKLNPTKPRNLFETIMSVSDDYKNTVFANLNNGDNLHNCHGGARAFSKRLYSEFRFKRSVAEDAYSYLFCLKKGYVFKYVDDCSVFYTLPNNLTDHIKRSERYFNSEQILSHEFGHNFIHKQYKLPLAPFFIEFLRYLIKYPFIMPTYLFITLYIKFCSLIPKREEVSDTWYVSKSTKGVTI